MILLIGGTSETASLASGIAAAGYAVLVSTATDVPLAIEEHPRIHRRMGRLDEAGLVTLAKEKGIRAIVDAAHPYAVAAHTAAQNAAKRLGIPCLVFAAAEGRKPPGDRQVRLFAADHAGGRGPRLRRRPPRPDHNRLPEPRPLRGGGPPDRHPASPFASSTPRSHWPLARMRGSPRSESSPAAAPSRLRRISPPSGTSGLAFW